MQADEKKPPMGGMADLAPVMELSIERGGVFFPIYQAGPKQSGRRFMLRYTGPRCQQLTDSNVPTAASGVSTDEVKTVTILLTTAQADSMANPAMNAEHQHMLEAFQSVVGAASDFKYWIDIQPPGKAFHPGGRDVRDAPAYKAAVETLAAAHAMLNKVQST